MVKHIPFRHREQKRASTRAPLNDLIPLPKEWVTAVDDVEKVLDDQICTVVSTSVDHLKTRFAELKEDRYSKTSVSFASLKGIAKYDAKFVVALRTITVKVLDKMKKVTRDLLSEEYGRHSIKLGESRSMIQQNLKKLKNRPDLVKAVIALRNKRIDQLQGSGTA